MASLDLPWLIAGDFNVITSLKQCCGGNFSNYSRKAMLISDFIAKSSLVDISYIGNPFTWCNGQVGFARRWARLDRFLANTN